MPIKTLKNFQESAIDSAVALFTHAKILLDAAGGDAQGRAVAIHDNGYLLIDAPTGSGKTLMAGNIAEKMSSLDDIVWFWFAPFKGVVDQTAAFLREQFAGLRLRTLAEDRTPIGTRKGDIFVTTWSMVATRVKDQRNVRKTGEQNPSVDDLVISLREQGMRIGVVVDEAHHGFHGETQAAKFFREILQPEYTILVTATPDDADLADLQKNMQMGRLHRIGVSRIDAVGAGLIKEGIKCIAWKAEPGNEGLIDFETTALREGAMLHRLLKRELESAGISLVPLMLVQVASNEKSIERAKERLIGLGFTESQIAIHTAEEPDAGLLALANDETREVLIFKMAVALGFDAPRAWTLVSMRAARDPDFGVQLVGRILRVHRRLQGRRVSEPLRYGYVLLAELESQAGIDTAGQRINQLATEYAKVSTATVIVRIGNRDQVQVVGADGQTNFFPIPPSGAVWMPTATVDAVPAATPWEVTGLFSPATADPAAAVPGDTVPLVVGVSVPSAASYRYPIRPDVPRGFKTQSLPEDTEVTEEDCAKRFVLSTEHLFDILVSRDNVKVEKRTLEIFTQAMQMELSFTPPSKGQMRQMAQRELFRSDVFHAKYLREALLRRLHIALLGRGVADATDPVKLAELLDVLLSKHPELLREAQRAALAEGAIIEPAELLPEELAVETALPHSKLNVYHRMPPGMNSWEIGFGDSLDSDGTDTVLWWHRNPVKKPWSIKVLLVDGVGFYPDFIIGIRNRKQESGGLLADTKYAYDTNKELPKILAEHPSYGKVLILSLNDSKQWAIAQMSSPGGKAILGGVFRPSEAAAY